MSSIVPTINRISKKIKKSSGCSYLYIDDDEFEKILRHAVTLPVNDKIKSILEHFIKDDESHIVCLACELLQNYDK